MSSPRLQDNTVYREPVYRGLRQTRFTESQETVTCTETVRVHCMYEFTESQETVTCTETVRFTESQETVTCRVHREPRDCNSDCTSSPRAKRL